MVFLTLKEGRQHGDQKTRLPVNIGADMEKNKQDDAYRRLNRVLLVVERYCKPVTRNGRGGRQMRLKRGDRELEL